jgi:hypothetical protein
VWLAHTKKRTEREKNVMVMVMVMVVLQGTYVL